MHLSLVHPILNHETYTFLTETYPALLDSMGFNIPTAALIVALAVMESPVWGAH